MAIVLGVKAESVFVRGVVGNRQAHQHELVQQLCLYVSIFSAFICSHAVILEAELHKDVGTIHLHVFVSRIKVRSILKPLTAPHSKKGK